MTTLFRNSFRAATALLFAITISVGFSSCSDDDKDTDVNNPLGEGLYGTWFATKEHNSSLIGIGYHHIGQAAIFNKDGSGVWYFFLLNKQKKPVFMFGGKDKKYGRFHYTTDKDGTITIKLDIAPHLHTWTMKYQNGEIIAPQEPSVVTTKDASAEAPAMTRANASTITLNQATDGQACLLNMLDIYGKDGSHSTKVVDLSTMEDGYYYAKDGEVLTGKLSLHWDRWGLCCLDIEAGATVTLRNATIGGDDLLYDDYKQAHYYPGIYCYGNATIIIEGTVSVKGDFADLPCIYVNPGCTLTIRGTDDCKPDQENSSSYLIVQSGGHRNAGIGSGYETGYENSGNVTISHCRVYASGAEGPGIGSYMTGSCGSIQFKNKCYVEAQGNNSVAIGADIDSNCKEILILDGSTVIARANGDADWQGPAIGACEDGRCEKVAIISSTAHLYCAYDASEPVAMPILKWINADNIQLFEEDENFMELLIHEGYNSISFWSYYATYDRNGNELIIKTQY